MNHPTPIHAATAPPGADALRALLDASAMLLASARSEDVLSGIVELARSVIAADAYAVWRTADGALWHVVASRGLSQDYRTELRTQTASVPAIVCIPDVRAHPLVSEFAELYRTHGVQSLLVVPLTFQQSLSPRAGTITFYWRTRRDFTELDLAYASALANLCSVALNLAELNEQNQRERTRLSFLADASAVLASSLDYETTLERVAHLAVPQIADWCTVHIVERGVPSRLVVAHCDPAQRALAEEFSRRYPEIVLPDRGLGLVLRTGQSEFFPEITDAQIVAAARDQEHLHLLRELGLSGSILVALRGHDDKPLGAIRLLATGARTFRQPDLQLAEDLAHRAAAAIESAQLHREVLNGETRLRLAHSAARMGTWGWDLARNELTWSDEWKLLHNLPLDTPPSAELGRQLVHPDDREQVLRELADALASTKHLTVFEHRGLLNDGRIIWLHHRARIERDATGQACSIMGISMDVTERRQAEEALRRTEKLAAAGRLAATVAHEINNPLASIVNLIYLARLSPGLPPETDSLLDTAEGELNRTAQIVRQTLGFYRESVHPQDADVGRIVSEILDVYRSRIQARGLTSTTAIQPGLYASLIPGELKQVVANLISNAIDASHPGGSIHLAVTAASDHTVEIAVQDTGTGILPAGVDRLFEPFFTTKEDVGTGLGLWVSRGIVEKHSGSIRFHTSTAAEDHGTTFTVSLPLLSTQPPSQNSCASSS
ncbi:MAG: ATP-binding protein [Acidobacteriota bacterium]|nr:ATP-binding protein [Acidobacteriota bacterium]